MNEPFTERRANPRYRVKSNILLYNEITFAEIINISKGGVCCRFIMESKDQHVPCTTVDLLNAADKLYIQRLPCSDLNCHELLTTDITPASAVIRDCRLQFGDLADFQDELLDSFIKLAATDHI